MKNQSKRFFFLLFVLWISTKLSLVPQSQRGFVQNGLLETQESKKQKGNGRPSLDSFISLLAFKIFLFSAVLKENLTTTTVLFSCDTAIINLNFLFGNEWDEFYCNLNSVSIVSDFFYLIEKVLVPQISHVKGLHVQLNFYLSRTIGHRFWCTLNFLLIIVMMITMIIINDTSHQSRKKVET